MSPLVIGNVHLYKELYFPRLMEYKNISYSKYTMDISSFDQRGCVAVLNLFDSSPKPFQCSHKAFLYTTFEKIFFFMFLSYWK